jgi:hypothetical protein
MDCELFRALRAVTAQRAVPTLEVTKVSESVRNDEADQGRDVR